jgi:integrase
MALQYPKRLPTPTLRKGSLTYEMRVRVPAEARGERFKGTHATRTLGTRDKAEALRKIPRTYEQLHAEFEAEVTSLGGVAPATSKLTISDVCRIQRERLLESEEQYRKERVVGSADPVALAQDHHARLHRRLANARASVTSRHFANAEWLLTWLSKSGRGEVDNRDAALRALARNEVQVLREIIADDDALGALSPEDIPDETPTLSAHLDDYLFRRAKELTGERVAMFRAVVRDFIALAGANKPVSGYTKAHGLKFIDSMVALPANWTKDRKLRTLAIGDAASEAKSMGLVGQSAQSIRKKVSLIKSVFADAKDRYDGVHITFPTRGLPKAGAANEARDPFTQRELTTLLASTLPGHLHWLTWTGLCTGARLNELAQLTVDHIHHHGGIAYIYFDESMRLKTSACVRSVPLHSKLLELGFLEYVHSCNGPLFPGITQHSSGRFSDALSKAFRRHLEALGIKRPKLSFHSLRHTFAARFKSAAPRDVETRERLMGHDVPGVAGRYGGCYKTEASDMDLLETRAPIVETLRF